MIENGTRVSVSKPRDEFSNLSQVWGTVVGYVPITSSHFGSYRVTYDADPTGAYFWHTPDELRVLSVLELLAEAAK